MSKTKYFIDREEWLTVQDIIDILSRVEDKSIPVCIEVYPEWDNCTETMPLIKSRMWGKHHLSHLGIDGFWINGECHSNYFEDIEEEQTETSK